MRVSRYAFLWLVLAGLVWTAAASSVHKLVSPAEFHVRIEQGNVVVVDVRTPKEHTAAHIAHTDLTLNVHAPEFAAKIEALPMAKVYLVYCRSGHRSVKAVKLMEEVGFPVIYELDGGINAWKAAGLPVESGE